MDLIEIRKRAKELAEQGGKTPEEAVVPAEESGPPTEESGPSPVVEDAASPCETASDEPVGGPGDEMPQELSDEEEEEPLPDELLDGEDEVLDDGPSAEPAGNAPDKDSKGSTASGRKPDEPAPPVPPAKDKPGQGLPEADAEQAVIEYLSFMLGSEEYAVRVDDVREIIKVQHITEVPRTPDFVLGITSLRGVIIPVFDIRRRLSLEEAARARTTRLIVIADGATLQGIIVDRVTGVFQLKKSGIEPPPSVIGGVEAEYLDGIGRLGERLVILFNTARILSVDQL
ncbi:MAG TPA: chemotaxis protein CheW [Nitrospirota bacterium]|jgi:purine-binding chemotaxis protein CheW